MNSLTSALSCGFSAPSSEFMASTEPPLPIAAPYNSTAAATAHATVVAVPRGNS